MMLAYHGDPAIKTAIMAQLAAHRAADELWLAIGPQMPATGNIDVDALETLRHVRELLGGKYGQDENYGLMVDVAIAAWEKERAESALKARALEASPQAMSLYRADLATLRLEVLKVAEEMEGRTPEGNIIIDARPLGLWVKELAARLRKAAE